MISSAIDAATTSTSSNSEASRHQSTNFLIPKPLSISNPKLSLGCPILTRYLTGGLPIGTLTEICGESSTGKSQICLQLLLTALLPPYSGGLSASSLLILPSLLSSSPLLKRLCRLPSPVIHKPLDHIFVASAQSPEHLITLLYQADLLFEKSPSNFPVRLVIVDSIADIFRSEFENNLVDLKNRTGLFFRVASKLKEQACRFGSIAVVTNQVVDVVDSERGGDNNQNHLGPALWSSGRRVLPAMGLSWTNCVNTRIFLSRNDQVVVPNSSSNEDFGICRNNRRMNVVFAPHLPNSSCEFVIRKDGVFGVGDNPLV